MKFLVYTGKLNGSKQEQNKKDDRKIEIPAFILKWQHDKINDQINRLIGIK
jgi:hypothetical protein